MKPTKLTVARIPGAKRAPGVSARPKETFPQMPVAPWSREEEAERVHAVFERAIGQQSPLSPQQRGILLLRVVSGLSVEDVCLTLSLSQSAYHDGMREAERMLKAMLAGERGKQ